MSKKDWMNDEWFTPKYQEEKIKNFEVIKSLLQDEKPKKILDIGCGLAWESRLLQTEFDCELFLIDGDSSNNKNKNDSAVDVNYQNSVNDFLYYYSLQELETMLYKLGTVNFSLHDCEKLTFPDTLKFDLITSWVSCGFHYPISSYRDLILKHSTDTTKIVMDLRKKSNQNVEILEVLCERKKYNTCLIKVL